MLTGDSLSTDVDRFAAAERNSRAEFFEFVKINQMK